jgi:dihydropyrimidinase
VSDYSPWEGWPVRGWPVTTILRGRIVVDHGALHGRTSDGVLVPRKISAGILRRPSC